MARLRIVDDLELAVHTWGDADAPPVVITSAGSVSPKRLAEFGCAGWLPKPFPMETLVDTLDRLINAEGAKKNQ